MQAATGGSQDILRSLFKTYEQNALTFLGYSDPNTPISAWQQAAYMSQILDFSNIVKDKGLVDALNTYGASFFNAVAVNQIIQSGLTIGDYFKSKLDSGQYTIRTLQDGTQVSEVNVPDSEGGTVTNAFFIRKTEGESVFWDFAGKEDMIVDSTYLSWGKLGVDAYGKLGYTDAQLYSVFNSDTQFQRIENGEQAYAEIKDSQGNTLLVIEPTVGGHYNVYDSYGEYVDAKINSSSLGYDISFKNSLLTKYASNYSYWFTDEQRTQLRQLGYTDSDIDIMVSNINIMFDENGEPTLRYSINSDIQNPFDITSALGQEWLSGFEEDATKFYDMGKALLTTTNYTKNTKTLYNSGTGVGAVDMNLDILNEYSYAADAVKPLTSWLGLFQKLGYENSLWDMAVKDAAPEVSKMIDTTGANFVYVPGNRTTVDTLTEVQQMKNSLGVDKKVVVGWSAGTEAVIRSWATTQDKSVYYVLVSPRMMANSIETYAKQAGIDPSKILIVNAKGDVPDYSWGYGNGAPHNPHPWTHLFLTSDTTTPENVNDQMLGHSGPIDGWLNNHSYDIVIDGKIIREDKLLIEMYKRYINGEPL